MNQNPNLFSNVGYNEILLKKLSYAVISSVISQIVILAVFLWVVNINVLNPLAWFNVTVGTFMSVNTWLFLVPFSAIIFAQSIICAKDYVLQSAYYSTRFQRLFHILSLRHFVLLTLHIAIGGLLVWLYISFSGLFDNTPVECKSDSCIKQETLFLVLSGLWTGFYFFIKVYISDKKIQFPVIQQPKLLQFKAKLLPLINESRQSALWPTIYFTCLYVIFGDNLTNGFLRKFEVSKAENAFGIATCLLAWIFSTIYFVNMNLMRFFFNLYLTEPIEFSLLEADGPLSLQHAIMIVNLPIARNLACLDLYLLSHRSPARRQVLLSLSQPGGHPHHWNSLIENVLKLFTEYVQLLNKAVDALAPPDKTKKEVPVIQPTPCVQSPVKSPYTYSNMRNMSLYLSEPVNSLSISNAQVGTSTVNAADPLHKLKETLRSILTAIKRKLGYNYLFDELPEANVQRCLAEGQIIIWTSQGIASIAAASLTEDKYGIVQKDLPIIITTLTQLKQVLDKLNVLSVFSRRAGHNDFNYKMKLAVCSAVKRSLTNICQTFEDYLNDLPLSKEVMQCLQQSCLPCKRA